MRTNIRNTWPTSRAARIFDLLAACLLLLILMPLLLGIAVVVRAGGAPVWFSQVRFGRHGIRFRMWKFRTLRGDSGDGEVTPTGDPRVSWAGRWLRRSHLDELPQIVAVLRGEMSLVGPRPEVPDNLVAVRDAEREALWCVRPGLTGATQLEFLGEDDVLAELQEPTEVYRQVIVPAKVAADLRWLEQRTLLGDLRILLRTPFAIASPAVRRSSRERVRRIVRLAHADC